LKTRVVVFGLSANPPTGWGGHAGIVRYVASRDDVDEVWIVPVYRHAFPDKREMPSYEHRRAMAKLAFEQIEGAKVVDTERDLSNGPGTFVGTIDVMRKLIAEHPDTSFTLLLGGDTYRDLIAGRWKESRALQGLVPILVISRTGVPLEAGAKAVQVPGLTDVSSTAVRASQDPLFLHEALQPQVLEYIQSHGLYGFQR
jgi:nicotinate-nucleotide adenylyltransferase